MWMYSDELVASLYDKYHDEIASNFNQIGFGPKFDIILVGDDRPSNKYVEIKTAKAKELGIEAKVHKLDSKITQEELSEIVLAISKDQASDGLILQLPLPKHLDYRNFVNHIDQKKDLDGLSPISLGNLIYNLPSFISCTPRAIIALARFYKIQFKQKKIVLLGTGPTVGRPLILLLQNLGLANNLTNLSKDTFQDADSIAAIKPVVKEAEILISALGIPNVIQPDMIKKDVIIFDVGLAEVNGVIRSDVDPRCQNIASFISPTYRGIGPITVAFLLESVIKSWKSRLLGLQKEGVL